MARDGGGGGGGVGWITWADLHLREELAGQRPHTQPAHLLFAKRKRNKVLCLCLCVELMLAVRRE